jgi:hypothetical protein
MNIPLYYASELLDMFLLNWKNIEKRGNVTGEWWRCLNFCGEQLFI